MQIKAFARQKYVTQFKYIVSLVYKYIGKYRQVIKQVGIPESIFVVYKTSKQKRVDRIACKEAIKADTALI